MKKIYNLILTSAAMLIFTLLLTVSTSAAADTYAGKVVTSSGRLNVRSAPSQTASVVSRLEASSWVTIWGSQGKWYRVEYSDGKFGWCHSDYLRKYTNTYGVTVSISSGYLNIRTGASTNHAVQDKLTKNEDAVILYESSQWARVLYRGNKIGYAYKAHLKKSTDTLQGIALDVPSFKQTDSRWAAVPIGTKGGTIGTIGCTTTALAMTESYHTKSTVTPKMMASRLSYSASGSLYWPSYYSVEPATDSYLSRIYELLKSGKPVVLGAKKANGSQHWVTVTGFTKGGTVMSRSDFTINDPGSNTRKTVADFLAVYPDVYKIVFRK